MCHRSHSLRLAALLLHAAVMAPAFCADTTAASRPIEPPPVLPLDASLCTGTRAAEGFLLTAPVTFQYPASARGWHEFGFTRVHDGTRDWRPYLGLQCDVLVPKDQSVTLGATLETPSMAPDRQEFLLQVQAQVPILGTGQWQRITIPWNAFDFDKRQSALLRFIQSCTLRLAGDAPAARCQVRNLRVVRAPAILLDAPVRGKAAAEGQAATYSVVVGNCTDTPQVVRLAFAREAWQAMTPTITPAQVTLAPNQTVTCTATVQLPATGVAPGGHERHTLLALSGSDAAPLARVELVTARDLPRPFLLHTPEGWKAVREKVRNYSWANESQDADYVRVAEDWSVPEAATPAQRAKGPEGHPYVFLNPEFDKLYRTAIAWQLTRNRAHAEKVALFLRRLADPQTGYASTCAATSMGEPQEGGNFQNIAIAYDAILDASVLSESDRASIEAMLRLYMRNIETQLTVGNVGNWATADDTAGLFAALAMGDLAAADRYLHGPAGFTDYLSKGLMDDGWWWECSTSYNFWVAAELTQAALACRPWGIDLLHQQFPANFSPQTILTPWAQSARYGINFEKWGPNHRNTRTLKQFWDAVPTATDYRGVTFGMNDGHEERATSNRFELAYYAFRDPMYASFIKLSPKRDLIYGIPELPTQTPAIGTASTTAENMGFASLRSQTPGRPIDNQIQAVFKIGTQGGYHGHFDRTGLNAIMRYGRSFWNPEVIWYGYNNFMYKFYVQTSVNHNMVVVDGKQQEAVPSSQLLFHAGKMMQAVVQETNARWSDPPYGGMRYEARDSGGAVPDLATLQHRNQQSFPIVTDREWGDMGPWSDRVLQRRAGIVTDDYILIADYLHSEQPHIFDNLFQMKGLTAFEAENKKLLRHDAQYDTNPRTSGQFITDCDWFSVSAPAVARFKYLFGPGEDRPGTQFNNPGQLLVDLHPLWPQQQELMLATPPENLPGKQWVSYEVSADGASLAKGETGAWILGAVPIDVPLHDQKELLLSVSSQAKDKSLFWSSARLITAEGKEIALPALARENVSLPEESGKDYAGGPLKIAGVADDAALPTQPADPKKPALLRIPLTGTHAVRFKATLGADYPIGNEAQRRKLVALRTRGTSTRYLTLVEPYDARRMVLSARALSADAVEVHLADGRTQTLTIDNLEGDGKNIRITLTETVEGQPARTESSE